MTAGWRGEILREFTPGVARLTVVDDPDGLLAETSLVEALRARGFEVISLDDRIAFRFFYESRYRSRRGRGDLADVVAVFTTGEAHEHAVRLRRLAGGPQGCRSASAPCSPG